MLTPWKKAVLSFGGDARAQSVEGVSDVPFSTGCLGVKLTNLRIPVHLVPKPRWHEYFFPSSFFGFLSWPGWLKRS